jgi:hypothetical protein
METVVLASHDRFEQAVAAASRIGRGEAVEGLAASVDAAVLGRVEEAWDGIVAALREGFRYGREKAAALLDAAVERTEQIIQEAGARGREVHEILLQRLREYAQETMHSTLAQVPATIQLGGGSYSLTTVNLTHKLVVTGSVKTNLMEAFSLAASREIEISAEYARAPE